MTFSSCIFLNIFPEKHKKARKKKSKHVLSCDSYKAITRFPDILGDVMHEGGWNAKVVRHSGMDFVDCDNFAKMPLTITFSLFKKKTLLPYPQTLVALTEN